MLGENMNIENLLEKEKRNSYAILKSKIGHYGHDFIEDVYCDARLKALKSFHKYQPDRPFKGWWNQILIHALVDKVNGSKPEQSIENIDKSYDVIPQVLNNLTISEITDALRLLPLSQQRVFQDVLDRHINNTPHAKATAQDRLNLHKARKKIKKILQYQETY
jgi:DNA-directed RNA polymerase specialized sigma24 family protein